MLNRLLALPALLGLAACGPSPSAYEEAGRAVAASIGADDLAVYDSVSNFAVDSGRTVRFTVAGDPAPLVRLHFVTPEICDAGQTCADLLRRNDAYARAQGAHLSRLAAAFAPCGFRGGTLFLVNAGQEPRYQFVEARLSFDVPEGADPRAAIGPCAEALAREVGGRAFAPDDAADWFARPVDALVYAGPLPAIPAPRPPLVLAWEDALKATSGAATAIMDLRLDDGRATFSEVRVPAN